jgi:hypothetical protein
LSSRYSSRGYSGFRRASIPAVRCGAHAPWLREYDVVRQGLVSHHYWIEDGKVDVISPPFRYVWPSELDLMARLAGMTLRERWGAIGSGSHSTADSPKHVSVWEKTAAGPF